MHRSRPLFEPDPGWLFLAVGLALIVAAVVIPSGRQLLTIENQVIAVHGQEATVLARLRAHAEFRDQLEAEDPTLMRQLASSQLNLIRRGDRPVLTASTAHAPITDWIDGSVQRVAATPRPVPDTRLTRLVTGLHREWVLAAAAFCVFVGLVLGPGSGGGSPAMAVAEDGDPGESGAPATSSDESEATRSAWHTRRLVGMVPHGAGSAMDPFEASRFAGSRHAETPDSVICVEPTDETKTDWRHDEPTMIDATTEDSVWVDRTEMSDVPDQRADADGADATTEEVAAVGTDSPEDAVEEDESTSVRAGLWEDASARGRGVEFEEATGEDDISEIADPWAVNVPSIAAPREYCEESLTAESEEGVEDEDDAAGDAWTESDDDRDAPQGCRETLF